MTIERSRRNGERLLLAGLVALLFIVPLIRGEVFTARDHTDYFQPLRYFTTLHLRHLDLPLWNPYNGAGEPWLANPQTGIFYPPAWLFLVLPFATAYMLYLMLHLLLLAQGAYSLFVRIGCERGALIAATALTFCGPVLSLLDISNNLATIAWIPLVLWCASTRAGRVTSAATIAMSFLAGEPFFATMGALMFAMILLRQKRVGELLKSALLAAGLCAVQLLPFLEMLKGSDRSSGLSRQELFRDSMAVWDWLRLFNPPPSLDRTNFLSGSQHFIPLLYVGALVGVLALAGIVATLLQRSVRVLGSACAALLLFSMVVGAGNNVPIVSSILERLPLTIFRYPARLVPLGVLSIVTLAALGWSTSAEKWMWMRSPLVAIPLALFLFLDLAPRAAALLRADTFRSSAVPWPERIGSDGKLVRLNDGRAFHAERGPWVAGYLNLYGPRYDSWTAAPVVSQGYTRRYEAAVQSGSVDALSALSIRYVLAPRELGAVPLTPVARAGDAHLYENKAANPLAWFLPARGEMVPAQLLAVDGRSMQLSVSASAPGRVVIAQRDAPGWSVRVDGMPARPLLEDGLFRAVAVTAGKHRIEWRYRPLSLIAGAILTLVALTACALQRRSGRLAALFDS